MKIKKLSSDFTPLHEGVIFDIDTEATTPSDIEVKIIEIATGEIVATQLLRNTVKATINIAPYVKIPTVYAPAPQSQTTFSEAPTSSYKVRIGDIESESVVVSVNRSKVDSSPFVLTALPSSRRLFKNENDELLIVTDRGSTLYAEIVADTGESLHFEYFTSSGAATLSLSTQSFETMVRALDVTIYCDEGEIGSFHYKVTPRHQATARLAWLSDCGAIEHYTFATSYRAKRSAKREIVATSEGVVSASCRAKQSLSLSSHIEPQATIEALAQIASSPKVWMEVDGSWHLVEVVTPYIEHNLFGEPSYILLEICLWEKEVALW